MSRPNAENNSSTLSRLVNTKLVSTLANVPPFSWILYGISRFIIWRNLEIARELEETIVPFYSATEPNTLEMIVRDVVRGLGYAAAFVAPYEQGDMLPIRAMFIDPKIISQKRILELEEVVSGMAGRPMSLTDPFIACVYRYDEYYKDNLSIRAVNQGAPVIDKSLFSLFTPIAPPSSRPMFHALQDELGIEEVVALPFFISRDNQKDESGEIVGNLFAVKQSPISEQDIRILLAFGRQAASAIAHERRKTQVKIAQDLVYNLQRNIQNQHAILQDIVEGTVHELNYVAAMIALTDERGALTIQAFHVDESVTEKRHLVDWAVEFTDIPEVANSGANAKLLNINLHESSYAQNLSYQACAQGQPLQSDSLYSLFHNLLPPETQTRFALIQKNLGIQRIVAVPFYLHGVDKEDNAGHELVGVLYAASRSRDFSYGEIELLVTFGEQAAASIKNAQIYDISVKRQRVSVSFARMAFNATASLHKFRNLLSPVRLSLNMLSLLESMPDDTRNEIISTIPTALQSLTAISDLLDSLDRPFIEQAEELGDVVQAIGRAKDKLNPYIERSVSLNIEQTNAIPHTLIFSEMLVEVFSIILTQAIDAVTRSRIEQGQINVCLTYLEDKHKISVSITHNGITMTQPELMSIFDIHDNTQDRRMGFGLFWAYDFIHGIGGNILVTSNRDAGTTFTIDIPVRGEK